VEGDLLVKSASMNRALRLPRRMALLDVSEAHFRDGVLSVFFRVSPAGSAGTPQGNA
jgi:HSP20 family molecular chaperone IbpA